VVATLFRGQSLGQGQAAPIAGNGGRGREVSPLTGLDHYFYYDKRMK